MFDDPALRTMTTEKATIDTKAADVLSRYGAQHPEHQQTVAHLAKVEELIADEVRRNVEAERAEVSTLVAQESDLTTELGKVRGELLEKQKLQEEFASIKAEQEQAESVYTTLGKRGAEVALQAQSQLNDVRIVDKAVPPTKPASPNIPLNLAAALFVGTGGGIGLALLRHRMIDRISSPGDVEAETVMPLLGVIPRVRAASGPARALYAFERPRSRQAEALRAIRAILSTYPGRVNSRRLVVTSCLEEEGKSHAAIGVAVAFAQLGSRVLLIDADLRRPTLHTLFGMAEGPGLAEVIAGADIERAARPTVVAHLDLLPRGAAVDYPNELLASPELERLLSRLRATYSVIVIDTPPAAVVSDALALARGADGVIVVVRSGKISPALVNKTAERLEQVGANILGVVLNDVAMENQPGYGSRYYDEAPRSDRPAST